MKAAILFLLLSISVHAFPAFDAHVVLGGVTRYSADHLGDNASGGVTEVLHEAEKIFDTLEEKAGQWVDGGRNFIKQNGLSCVHATDGIGFKFAASHSR